MAGGIDASDEYKALHSWVGHHGRNQVAARWPEWVGPAAAGTEANRRGAHGTAHGGGAAARPCRGALPGGTWCHTWSYKLQVLQARLRTPPDGSNSDADMDAIGNWTSRQAAVSSPGQDQPPKETRSREGPQRRTKFAAGATKTAGPNSSGTRQLFKSAAK
jgi:hypothetical protein